MQVQISEERQVQLSEYAARHGQDPAAALDEILDAALEWDRQDSLGAIEGLRRGYASMQAGHTRPVPEFLKELRTKHEF